MFPQFAISFIVSYRKNLMLQKCLKHELKFRIQVSHQGYSGLKVLFLLKFLLLFIYFKDLNLLQLLGRKILIEVCNIICRCNFKP